MFQKNLVVWKPNIVFWVKLHVSLVFQKNLVVWKRIPRLRYILHSSFVSEELSSVETH